MRANAARPAAVPGRSLQRPRRPAGDGDPHRRPDDLRRRRRPAQHGRSVPGQRRPLRGAPAGMAARLRLAVETARMPSWWTATPRTNSCWRPTEVATCARSRDSSPATRSRSGASSAASCATPKRRRICCRRCSCAWCATPRSRGGRERGHGKGRREVLDLALHHRAQPLHRPRAPQPPSGDRPRSTAPSDAERETTGHAARADRGARARQPTRWWRDAQAARRIDRAVAELPDDQREVFLMREVMEMPFAEIASVVGASEPTVKSRMRYALEKLRAALADLRRRRDRARPNQRGQDKDRWRSAAKTFRPA